MLARGELQTTGNDDDAHHDLDRSHLDEAAAAFGLVIERAEGGAAGAPGMEPFHLWPEHVAVLGVWFGVQTQWRHGFAGPTGLDYAGVRAAPAFRALARQHREPAFDALCIMERATLGEWARMRDEARGR